MEFDIESRESTEITTKPTDYSKLTEITTLDSKNLSYEDFFSNFLLKNVPCLIRGITDNWEATRFWIKNNSLDTEYMNKKYGECNVTIYNCEERYFNSQNTRKSIFREYLDYWEKRKSHDTLEYLKDWHLKLIKPEDNFYEVPSYFSSDWLNEYYVQCLDDDYRFVYIGVKSTWTPFHADVFTSYSWSANVFGKKKWLLFAPGEENHLKDNLNNLPYDVTKINHSKKYFEVIQNAGEAIFVPSGWHHQVWNLEDTVSINHNWVNGCNVHFMWDAMKNTFLQVIREIEDCKSMDNFDEHCQVMLKATFGMDFEDVYGFLKCITTNRIKMLRDDDRILFHGNKMGRNHVKFDLRCLKSVLLKVKGSNEINYEGFGVIKNKCSVLVDEIETAGM